MNGLFCVAADTVDKKRSSEKLTVPTDADSAVIVEQGTFDQVIPTIHGIDNEPSSSNNTGEIQIELHKATPEIPWLCKTLHRGK